MIDAGATALLGFNFLAVAGTFLGGLVPMARNLLSSRTGIWRMFSLRAGILLAVALTEILPEALKTRSYLAGWGAVAAFVLLILMENFAMVDSCPEYLEECEVHPLGLLALTALFSHSFIDGFNLGVSFQAGSAAGAAVGLALTLHKVADGFTLTTLFAQSNYSARQSVWGLFAVAAATPLGSVVSAAGVTHLSPAVTALLLGFAGGSFLYIGTADLVRRVHRHHDRLGLLFFGLGLFGMAALKAF